MFNIFKMSFCFKFNSFLALLYLLLFIYYIIFSHSVIVSGSDVNSFSDVIGLFVLFVTYPAIISILVIELILLIIYFLRRNQIKEQQMTYNRFVKISFVLGYILNIVFYVVTLSWIPGGWIIILDILNYIRDFVY